MPSSRTEELILLDRVNSSNLKKHLTSAEHDGLGGTTNLSYIKKYASLLNCSWQYLAGLSHSIWSEDIICKSPQTQGAVLFDTILNHTKAYYNTLDFEQKEKFDFKIGERIRKLREMRGFSQSDVAAYIDISHKALSKFESGETPLINNRHLNKLSESFTTLIDNGSEQEKRLALNLMKSVLKYIDAKKSTEKQGKPIKFHTRIKNRVKLGSKPKNTFYIQKY